MKNDIGAKKPATHQLPDLLRLPAALKPLIAALRWVNWKWEERKGKWTKPLIQPRTLAYAKTTEPSTWGSHTDAVARVKAKKADGIGFNLLGAELGAVDLDHCRDPDTGIIAEWAQQMITRAPDAYVEVTVSGTGLRIIGTAKGAELHKKFPAVGDSGGSFELYRNTARYITVSGLLLEGRSPSELPNIDGLLDELFAEHSHKDKKQSAGKRTQGRDGTFPRQVSSLLHVDGSGTYASRSELLFAFINLALRRGIDENAIVTATLDDAYAGKGIYEHCAENGGEEYVRRQIEHALNNAELPIEFGSKTTIHIAAGDRHIATARTEKALIAASRPIFHRAGSLVEPIWRFEKTGDSARNTLVAKLLKLNVSRLSYMTAKHAVVYLKYSAQRKQWEPMDPPDDVMRQLLDLGHWGFPSVRGIINSPTMRPDGSLLIQPGYDAATELWFKSSEELNLSVPEHPTKSDALAAFKLLKDLLAGFPFTDDVSISVAMAGLMTPVLRGAFDFAPLFFFMAPESGTGKSYLVAVISTLATGRIAPAVVGTRNVEEMEKRLSAAAFEGIPILSLNNLGFDLESDLLNQMITEETVKLRVLGKNDQLVACDCRGMSMFANGNNVRIAGDLVRRALTAHLDAKMEDPETRTFKFDPLRLIRADRAKHLTAVFTIARAYSVAERHKVTASPLAGFDGWSNTVRYPLIWLGCSDPVESMQEARANDPRREEFRDRLRALTKVFGAVADKNAGADKQYEFTAADVYEKAREQTSGGSFKGPVLLYPELSEAFGGEQYMSAMSAKSIGNQLAKDVGRVVKGYRLMRVKESDKGHRYKVIGEKEIPSHAMNRDTEEM